jgi:hypothetical protein
MYIDFMIASNPPGQVLGATAVAYDTKEGQFSFSFVDNKRNKGRGTFSRRKEGCMLHLEILQESSSSENVVSLYRDYHLVKAEEKGRSDRHPWSLGRVQYKP